MSAYRPGISIIIPSYAPAVSKKKSRSLASALTSLLHQTVRKELFDVIVVVNGPGALEVELDLRQRYPHLDLRVLRTTASGAGRARNLGIASAGRRYITFLDDDDALGPQFLEAGMEYVEDGACVLLPIHNTIGDNTTQENSLNARIATLSGSTVPVAMAPWALGFNASKIIPTKVAQKYSYSESLRSGEDVAYFARLLEEPEMLLKVPKVSDEAVYLRTIRQDSVSRQAESFDFSVIQRLECMRQLRRIQATDTKLRARQKLEEAQFGFVEAYLRAHPDDVRCAIDAAIDMGMAGLDWGRLRTERAKRLVFSYCFPPYADTSANVTAKVIRQEAELVDVFYASMGRVRGYDETTRLIVDPYLAHAEELDVVASFSHWGAICTYAREAVRKAHKLAKKQGGYESMYSRALWSGSHVAAALFKNKYPDTWWQAEFSDPLCFGIDGSPRQGKLTRGMTTYKFKRMIERADWPDAQYATHFELTELVTFLYADEIIFTNSNQQEVMLGRYPKGIQELVRGKSRVRHHAIPTKEMYSLVEAKYRLDSSRINIAYFGNFYANRGMDDVLAALMDHPARDCFQLHIFTSNPEALRRELWGHPAEKCLRINGHRPYLEFLNLLLRFDALVVMDTDISNTAFRSNPFLPSKYADYVGSGVGIWGIVTPNSPLSTLPMAYTSKLGDANQARGVLDELLCRSEYNAR